MNRFAIALALGAALLAPVAADANVAALRCQIINSQGSQLVYLFGDNTNSTVVETAFKKNGTIVASDVGQRPTWRSTSSMAVGSRSTRSPRPAGGSSPASMAPPR